MSLLAMLVAVLLAIWLLSPRAAWGEVADEGVSDDELVALAQAGDRHAFNRLVGRYQRLAFSIAYRVTGDTERAADATQEAFVSAYRHLGQYTGGSFRAWLARIVRNACYDLLRYEQRRPAASLDALLLQPDDPPPAVQQHAPDRPDEALLQAEVAAWLQAVILQLPADQRLTLVMADVQDFSYEEIAAAMEVELGTVKSRLFRARRKVREMLQANAELLPAQYRL